MRVLITASTRLTMMDWGPRSRTSNELSRSAACVGVIDRGHSLRWALPRSQCAFRGRSRTPEPTLIIERWFLSGCYRKADSIQHLDLVASLDDQPFDHIEAVQSPPLRGYLGEIPAQSWRGPTSVFLAIQDSPSFEDAVDGPHRGERFDLAALQGLVDGGGPMEPQVTGLLQLRSHGQDQIFDGGIGP